jgi:hypothetical protein
MISGRHKQAFGVAGGRVAARRPDRDFLKKDSELKNGNLRIDRFLANYGRPELTYLNRFSIRISERRSLSVHQA